MPFRTTDPALRLADSTGAVEHKMRLGEQRSAPRVVPSLSVLLTTRHRQAYSDICMRRVAVFISEELLAGLKVLKAEHGTPEAESIRRAIAAYLADKGIEAAPKGGGRLTKLQARKPDRRRVGRTSTVLTRSTAVTGRPGCPPFYGSPRPWRLPVRCALYARVSTLDQQPENQLAELRRYVAARGWTAVEYVDRGVSGAKDRRPALDQLLADGKRRRFDVLVCWRLGRLGRSLKHLITLLDEPQSLGVAFVSLAEGIDATTPAGKLQMHILGAIAEFERARIVERVRAGLARRKAQGKPLGRPRETISTGDLARTVALSTRKTAALLGVSHAAVHRARTVSKTPRTSVANCA